MARSLNTSHALYSNLRLILAVDDDNASVVDFKTPTRVVSLDSGVSVKAGTLGYVFELEDAGGGIAPRGINFPSTKPFLENGVGESMTIIFFFDRWTNGFNACRYPQWNTTSVGMPYFSGTGTNKAIPCIVNAGGTDTLITSDAAIPAATPCMIGLSYSRGGSMTLNVNGVTKGTASFPATDENNIAAIRGISGESVVADLFAVATYSKALSQTEFADLWASCTGNGNIGILNDMDPPVTVTKAPKIRLFYPDGTPASNLTVNWSVTKFTILGNQYLLGNTSDVTDADGWLGPLAPGNAAWDTLAVGDKVFITISNSDRTFTQTPAPFSYVGPCEIIEVV